MAKTHKQFVEELNLLNPDIEILSEYTRAVDRIQVRCKSCSKIWSPKAYSLLQGKSCSHCSAIKGASKNQGRTKLKTNAEFLNQLKEIHPNITVQSEYRNTHTNISCYCERCGTTWDVKPYSLLQGHGCPRCTKSGTSFMEQFIKLSFSYVLGDDAVISRDKSLIGMELDILIPTLKVAIEPGNWYLHKRSIDRDKLKRKKCSECGIRLITIYDKFPNSETVPFEKDCLTFSSDLNKSDHAVIRQLVLDLFNMCNVENDISMSVFQQIEEEAYSLAKSKTHEIFVNEMKSVNPDITIIGTYYNSNKRIAVKCNVCGNAWYGVPANLLSGDGCKKCGTKEAHKKFIKSQTDFIAEVAIANPNVKIIGNYTGRHNPIKAKCLICGHVWYPIASSLLRGSSHKNSKNMHKEVKK